MKNFLTQKIPVAYFLFITSFAILSTFLITFSYYHLVEPLQSEALYNVPNKEASPTCDYKIRRLEGYNYIKPLLYVDKNCETGIFKPMKQRIIEIIDKNKKQGRVYSASVYVRDFNEGDFMVINEEEKYKSASLMNVPLLMTYLHLDEDKAGYLDKEIVLEHDYPNKNNRAKKEEKTVVGKKYSLRNLLEYMIVNGDDNATGLLYENVDKKAFYKTFSDVGLAAPKEIGQECTLSAADISLFMRTLYNATYLTIKNSEYATKLLGKNETQRKDALLGLPTSVKLASEQGAIIKKDDFEQHESAIIYLDKCPYIITIMTKGNNPKQLTEVINQISAAVYTKIAKKNIP